MELRKFRLIQNIIDANIELQATQNCGQWFRTNKYYCIHVSAETLDTRKLWFDPQIDHGQLTNWRLMTSQFFYIFLSEQRKNKKEVQEESRASEVLHENCAWKIKVLTWESPDFHPWRSKTLVARWWNFQSLLYYTDNLSGWGGGHLFRASSLCRAPSASEEVERNVWVLWPGTYNQIQPWKKVN